MTTTHKEWIESALKELGEAREHRVVDVDEASDRGGLYNRIVATAVKEPESGLRPAGLRPRLNRYWRALSAVAAVGAVLVVVLATRDTPISPVENSRAFGAIEVNEHGDYLTVQIVKRDPDAAAIKKAFEQYGFDIEVRHAAATPGQAGFFVDDESGNSLIDLEGVETIVQSDSECKFAQCRYVGLRVPRSLPESAYWMSLSKPIYVTIGREPRSDSEGFVQSRSAFSQGEILHCSGLIGDTVAEARGELEQLGLNIVWNAKSPAAGGPYVNIKDPASSAPGYNAEEPDQLPGWLLGKYVMDGDHTAPNDVRISAISAKPSSITGPTGNYLESLRRGC